MQESAPNRTKFIPTYCKKNNDMHQNPSYPHLIRISLKQQDPYPQVTTPMFKGTKMKTVKQLKPCQIIPM